MSGPRLPSSIVLPTAPTVTTADLVRAFGVTRQALWKWRKSHGFPMGTGGTARTELIAAWAAARGAPATWI